MSWTTIDKKIIRKEFIIFFSDCLREIQSGGTFECLVSSVDEELDRKERYVRAQAAEAQARKGYNLSLNLIINYD